LHNLLLDAFDIPMSGVVLKHLLDREDAMAEGGTTVASSVVKGNRAGCRRKQPRVP
jgi:hypothetical protein